MSHPILSKDTVGKTHEGVADPCLDLDDHWATYGRDGALLHRTVYFVESAFHDAGEKHCILRLFRRIISFVEVIAYDFVSQSGAVSDLVSIGELDFKGALALTTVHLCGG